MPCNLHHARLWRADLSDAGLADCHDLVAQQLAGVNTAGEKLPEAVMQFGGLRQIHETTEIARPMFLLMLLVSLRLIDAGRLPGAMEGNPRQGVKR